MTFDDTEKEFSYKGVSLTRYDYESLPCPMAATLLDDSRMTEIARDTHDYLIGNGWSQADIDRHVRQVDDYEDGSVGDMIKSDFWRFMERAAQENGMQYWEDIPERQEAS